MSDDEVIERYMRRFDRAVGAEPAALNELLESFSDDAVVNFDGTSYAGGAGCWSCSAGSSGRWSRRTPLHARTAPRRHREGAVGSIRPDVRRHRHGRRRH
jgi:hypothetical protein